jgi:hypothetical protein
MSLSQDLNDIPKLFGDAVEQLGKLVQNEAQLARTEMAEKITRAGIGAGYLAGAAALCIPVLVMLLMALSILLIQSGLSPFVAYLASAVIGAILSGILAAIGFNRFTPENLTPSVTIKEISRDVATAKELAR